MSKELRERDSDISSLTTRRLSIYLRCLEILEVEGVETVSSKELADRFHLNPAQFRKDLAYFGEFGIRGIGYQVSELRRQLVKILGLDREVRLVIIGAGNLGSALTHYNGFNTGGLKIVGIFDSDPEKIGRQTRNGLQIHDVKELPQVTSAGQVDIAILAVPVEAGQRALEQVAAAGIQAVLNFVPARLNVPRNVRLKTVDLKVQVESLVFHLARQEGRSNQAASSSP